MRLRKTWAATATLCVFLTCAARADLITLAPAKDTSLFEDPTGAIAGGASTSLYVGRLGSNGSGLVRRAALAFNPSAIPATATITDVQLTLNLNRGNGGPRTITLHRLTQNWGEGASSGAQQGAPSTPGSATWLHTFHDASTWSTPGGDFALAPSAAQNADFTGLITWSSVQMRTDLQGWLQNPAGNFGWILIGSESELSTAKEFGSREGGAPPALTITYTVPEPATALALAATALLMPLRPPFRKSLARLT